jgi:hypothetical protein
MIVGGKPHPSTVVSSCFLSACNAPTFVETLDTERLFYPILRSPEAIALIATVPIESVASPQSEEIVSTCESVDSICDLLGRTPDQLLSVSHESSSLNVNFTQIVEDRLANLLIDTGAGSSYVSQTFVREQKLVCFSSLSFVVSGAFGNAVSSNDYCKICLKLGAYSGFVVFRVVPLSSYDLILGRDWISSNAVSTDWDKNEWLPRCADGKQVVFTPGVFLCAPHDLAFISDDKDLIPLSRKAFCRKMKK